MKNRIIDFTKTYLLFLCIFMLQKPLFMLFYRSLYADHSATDWLNVVYHGLPLDLSLSGYLTALPGLFLIASVWTQKSLLRSIWKGYYMLIAVLLSVICIVDLGLYEYWGFRLDATPLFYFFTSPKDAVASVSLWVVIGGIAGMMLLATLLYFVFSKVLLGKKQWKQMKRPRRRIATSFVLLLLTALLFIPIRGGFTVSTMNTGKVYFSSNLRLNHAATNPAFSLMESLSKQKDFASQYRFMDAGDADKLFASLQDRQTRLVVDSMAIAPKDTLLTTQRPDILLIILESFSSHLMESLGGKADVAVCMDSLVTEGVLFTNIYANSFRTDRGLVSVLGGYPAQPTTSIMKYPRKTQSLPSIAGSLRKAGYRTKYYYGGDADFTNMRSYLMSSGFQEIVSDKDFPVTERLSKWGVHDHITFDRLLSDLRQESENSDDTNSPCYRVLQTSSSHEPFEVPYSKLQDERLNAFAYTDSCLGDFIRKYKELPQWKNTLVILIPDHLGAYPRDITNLELRRYTIPLLMVGGAVSEPRRIDVYGSQHDLAATLLAQLGLPHGEFAFSKDLLDEESPHFAFFTVSDAFGMVTPENQLIYDCRSGRTAVDEGSTPGKNLEPGKAYLQKLYDDLARR